MNELLSNITQISIYLKEEADRVNEIALFQPLMRKSNLTDTGKSISQRKWSHPSALPLFRRISLKFHRFLFKRIPSFIPYERLTPEAKFKTVLALLLTQENIRDFFLSDKKRKEDFFFAIEEAAKACGYLDFSCSAYANIEDPMWISQNLTRLESNKKSLIEDLNELNLQMAAVNDPERSEILFRILNKIERPPITSVVEITCHNVIQSIRLTTQYAKYKILHWDSASGKMTYSFSENRATSSVRTQKNSLPDAKGTMHQRAVSDDETHAWIGFYCGELSTPYHVLEQILLIMKEREGEAYLLDHVEHENIIEKKIFFTSLFSWHELGQITEQRSSIRMWDHKILKCGNTYYRLNLLYFNIPFNALNKYPTPSEVKAVLQDINDEALITLANDFWNQLNLKSDALNDIAGRIETLKCLPEKPFLKKEQAFLEEIDAFKKLKNELAHELEGVSGSASLAFKTLLTDRMPDGKKLKGIDKLLYLDYVAKHLGYYHNKNCQNATGRSMGANAADKAHHAYQKIYHSPFLPGCVSIEEQSLFKILYSMYLIWEEPEINVALNTDFWGEKFSNHFIPKNPEITRYLVLH